VGVGKSTVAKELQKRLPKKTALFERDYFMHKVIPWEDNNDVVNRALSKLTHLYLADDYNVLLEGTFTKKEDVYLINKLKDIGRQKNVNVVFLYLNSTLETSLKRNKLRSKDKSIKDEWMKKWYQSSIPKNIEGEMVIETDKLSLQKVVENILEYLSQFTA